jgi:hypothetical protein
VPALEQTHRAYVRAGDETGARLHAVDTELRDLLSIEPLRARVERLRCFRGIDDLTALTIAAELGDARRFPSASRVMAFTGLVPSEYSSGSNRPAARSPKRAMLICGASSSRPPGSIGTTHFWAARFSCASAEHPRPSSTTLGAPSTACIAATDGSSPAANPNNTSSRRSRGNSQGFSGPP